MQKIDFVVTWVDGNDPVWLASKEKYAKESNLALNSDARYRDWDIFKYWFRAVEKYAPWVNKIFLITEGHLPKWINLEHPKLVHIKHSDYIDEQYLPTFNSNVIELNISNINELSENFVLFNDDMFINAPVLEGDFFDKDGLPKDIGIFSPIVPKWGGISSIVLNNLEIINKYFNARDVLKKSFKKFYNFQYGKHVLKNICVSPWKPVIGFYDNHIPISYQKSNFNKVLQLEEKTISVFFINKFRTKEDFSHWLIRYWQICEGNFVPRRCSFGSYYNVLDEIDKSIYDIRNSVSKVICLNDGDNIDNFDFCYKKLHSILESKYKERSSFEILI